MERFCLNLIDAELSDAFDAESTFSAGLKIEPPTTLGDDFSPLKRVFLSVSRSRIHFVE